MMSFEDFKKQLDVSSGSAKETTPNGNVTETLGLDSSIKKDDSSSIQSQPPQQGQKIEIKNFQDLHNVVQNYLRNNKTKILIATPCYGGMVHSGYFQSMLELASKLTLLGVPYEVLNVGNESLITRARNGIVAKFLGNIEYSHLMFIDADITFPWLAVIRLLLSGKDVCGGCYPKKAINWEKVKRAVSKNKDINDKELIARSVDMVFNPVYFKEGNNIIAKLDNGFVQVKDVATGFMMIKRNVFTSLMFKFPELKYNNNVAGYHNDVTKDYFYTFFDTVIDDESRVYLSEDYYFCKLWKQCGGELWLDLSTNLNHCGVMDYVGALGLVIGEEDDLNQDTVKTKNTIH